MKTILLLLLILLNTSQVWASINMEALKMAESEGDTFAESNDGFGSKGHYQITPPVLADYNHFHKTNLQDIDLYDSLVSLTVADWYLGWLWERLPEQFRTDRNVLIAWNWGIGNWRKWAKTGMKADDLPKATKGLLTRYGGYLSKKGGKS